MIQISNHGLVPRDENPNSIAVVGADGETAFEGTDAPANVVIVYGLGIVAALATFCFALMFGYDKFLESRHSTGEPCPALFRRTCCATRTANSTPAMDRLAAAARARECRCLASLG